MRFDIRTGRFLDAPEPGLAVSLYMLSTCPGCRKTKKYFTDHRVPFDCIDYDLADDAMRDRITRELDTEVVSSFPFVRIGDQIVEGYRPDRFAELLGI